MVILLVSCLCSLMCMYGILLLLATWHYTLLFLSLLFVVVIKVVLLWLFLLRVDPIKLAYSPCQPGGRLKLTASTFNRLRPYASSPVLGSTATWNSMFLPQWWPKPLLVLIAPTHGGMARLSGTKDKYQRWTPIPVLTGLNVWLCWCDQCQPASVMIMC